ncbi:Threonyl-tRNA synthetase [Patulibacter medicamentivorans]|uniref:Threonine--tRNA ligase n=1 Tax=Patulibacter medicamentivorans TaxID=1097667 RepID=H0E7Q2_9ACTN|nr:threonine--tRNA ligase [Patulibacter medicamentivorans]EHN10326.1 Threonyl-tRNA synthetase [Patulibacter medicamentivorans]
MQVTLPDGKALDLQDGATGADAAAAIGPGLARAALAIVVDGEQRDLGRPLPDGAVIGIVTDRSDEALELIRHDTAHVLAAAILDLYPGTKIAIGPPIENGFYYDFEFPEGVVLNDGDFAAIEARMAEHVAADEPFVRQDVTVAEALERFRAEDQPYKVELIEDLVRNAPADAPVETVSLYTNGPFTDLCRGPHAPTTKRIGAFKLQSLAGAYWRGDSDRQQLVRIYGTAFFKRKDLEAHLERLELARQRDHRKLGKELGLYHFSEAAPGSAFWTPAGTRIFNDLVGLSREMGEPRGYTEVKTPQLFDSSLWKTSGHWDKYRDDMFLTSTGDAATAAEEGRAIEPNMGFKPMNCPGHYELYRQTRWSYRDLPVRFSEPGLLHRNELSGALHGLLRVRQFCQDDAHLFVTEEQIQDEVTACLKFAQDTYRLFGFSEEDFSYELSTRPENRLGSDELWDKAEGDLQRALEANGLAYTVHEGDGAFYGPKIDIQFHDSLGRSWQLGTVQIDYQAPERFDLTYTGADNAEHRPVVLHRALLGSYERFIGILLEHTGGELPFWLQPVHLTLLTVSDRHADAAHRIAATLKAAGLRVAIDDRTETVGRKIRETELAKVPLMAVIGDREADEDVLTLRHHGGAEDDAAAVAEIAATLGGKLRERALR